MIKAIIAGRAAIRGTIVRGGAAAGAGLALLLAPGGAAADGHGADPADVAALRACIGEADDPRTCSGLLAEPCLEAPDGQTTLGIVACMQAETAAWDVLLNETYRDLMERSRDADAYEAPEEIGLPSRVRSLRDAQRAWIVFRDADCLHAYAYWGSGSMRNIMGADCMLERTSERVIDLLDFVLLDDL